MKSKKSKYGFPITPITAEKAGRLRREGKITITLSHENARNMMKSRGKRVVYQLPNGVFGVMT